MGLSLFLLLIAAFLASSGQMFLKLLAGKIDLNFGNGFLYRLLGIFKEPVFFLALFAYGVSSVIILFLFKKLDVSLVYPIFLGFSVLLILIFGSVFLKESLASTKIIGMLLIIAGIFTAWFFR